MNSEKSTDNNCMLQALGITKYYPVGNENISVLKSIDLQVRAGDLVAVMGPSGAGKSTLLYILGLLMNFDDGRYLLDGIDVLDFPPREMAKVRLDKIGFVFQQCDLLTKSTVFENIELPLMYAGVPRHRRKQLIEKALERLNLAHRIKHDANKLSGGEKQRVAIARALANDPSLILADEPTGQLDNENSDSLMNVFQQVAFSIQKAVIIVTHDHAVADKCSKVYKLYDGKLILDS